MPVNSFGAVAFDDNWYLGQLVQWPSPPDLKKTKAIYVLQSNIAIAPRDSGLRMWKVCSTSTERLDKEYKRYEDEFI